MSHPPCDRVVVAFELNERPQPKRRARSGNGRHYTPAETVAYENRIADAARAEMVGDPRLTDVEVWCLFELRSARHAGDLDNLEKSVMDALNGLAYKDDRQVAVIRSRRVLRADRDRISVAILTVKEPA